MLYSPYFSLNTLLEGKTLLCEMVSAQSSVTICSFHKPEQLDLVGGASSSQLQLSGTHCHSPSISCSQF